MKKKAITIFVLVISFTIAIYLTCFRDNPQHYTGYIISEEQYAAVIAERSWESGLLETLIFDEQTLIFDNTDKTFYYSLVEGSSGAYDPYVKIKGADKNLTVAFLGNAIAKEGIKNNQTVSVLAYTDKGYDEYALKCTLLPIMNIECTGEIGDVYVPMTVTLFDNRRDAANRVTVSEGNIHIRGASARTYPKKSYRLSLKQESIGGNTRTNQVSLLGMRQDDDWLLYAAFDEPERVRNVFSSNLWKYTCAADNAKRIDTGIEYKYLELFMNGNYWGLYALGYPVDEKLLGIDSGNESVSLYKKISWASESELSITQDGVDGYEIKGGAGGWPLLLAYYYNLYLHSADNDYLYAGIDIDNMIDIYLFYNLIQGFDNVSGNAYHRNNLIKNQYILIENGANGLTALYVPWDLDYSWGGGYLTNKIDDNCIMESGYFNQIMVNGDTSLWEKIFEKYKYLRQNGWSEENIHIMLDEYESALYDSGAYLREMERWPQSTKEDASGGLQSFREYVMNRLQEADLYYSRMEVLCQKSIFISRSGEFKDFKEHVFIIEIHDKSLLDDHDYAAFFEYMGIDVASVMDDVTFIIANPSKGEVDYLSAVGGVGTAMETSAGIFSLSVDAEREYTDVDAYTVYLDGAAYYDTTADSATAIQMVYLDDGKVRNFDFTKGYELLTFAEVGRYLESVNAAAAR